MALVATALVFFSACDGRGISLAESADETHGASTGLPDFGESGDGLDTDGTDDGEVPMPPDRNCEDGERECPDGTCVPGGAFIPNPDACCDYGEICEGFVCDPGKQNCPEDEKCTAYVTTPGYCCVDSNKCVPVIGDKQLGEGCTRSEDNDDCTEGLFCMGQTSGDTGPGTCMAFCDINGDTPCQNEWADLPQSDCIPFNDGVMPLCETPCHPLLQDCPNSQACYPAVDTFVCAYPDFEAMPEGRPCWNDYSCMPGLACVDGEFLSDCDSERCCTRYCDCQSGDDECEDPGEGCTCYYDEGQAPEGYDDLGVCIMPG